MRVFMLGWEFPPYISGGLGTACHGLTKAMDKLGLNEDEAYNRIRKRSMDSQMPMKAVADVIIATMG